MTSLTLEYDICQPDDLLIDFDYITSPGFAEEATFSISSPPTGLDISFLPETATATDTPVEITISNTANVAPGSYTIKVLATTASLSKEVSVLLNVYDGNFATVPLLSPLNGALDVPTVQTLQWEGNSLYTGYDLELATDMAFNDIVQSVIIGKYFVPTFGPRKPNYLLLACQTKEYLWGRHLRTALQLHHHTVQLSGKIGLGFAFDDLSHRYADHQFKNRFC